MNHQHNSCEMGSMPAGTRVRMIADPGRIGVTTGKRRERAGRTYWQVNFPDTTTMILESQLEVLASDIEDPLDLLAAGKLGRARDLRGNLTYMRLNGRLANLIYSMETTNTDFYAYQFKPVINFLESPGDGILIADEVGLGKTIEAGLIWTELRSRFDARRLMVLCPAMLQAKWRDELLSRFGIDAEVAGPEDVLRRFAEYRRGDRFDYALVCSMQGLRPSKDWDDPDNNTRPANRLAQFLHENGAQEPLLDLLVVDEAHYMRNPNTRTAEIGRLLRDCVTHVVLLSATPIHLRNADLYQLLNLVDEDTFNQPEIFDFILDANRPIISARDAVLGGHATPMQVLEHLREAQTHPLLAGNRQLAELLEAPPGDEDLSDTHKRSAFAHRLERINLLARVVNRTRKREVTEWRVLREAVAEPITMCAAEAQFYARVTQLVRSYCQRRGAHEGFLLVTPQRQMSSSMPAALREWQERGFARNESTYEDTGAEVSDNEHTLGPLVSELVERATELGELAELWENDSKYRRLAAMLRRYLHDHPDEKIVLFSYFRATLRYLAERLRADGITCITLSGEQADDKQTIIDRFAQPKGPSVMLSSEVASEGVDLQFSRVLINYDLPWNPMRVEQRIGRIDRLGQRAPKVTIWNLFYADTIDSRIYERLYERLDIFRRALGGLEAVLGEEIRTLTLDLMRSELDPSQEAVRIEQAAQALANLRLQEEQLEEQAGNLIAHGDYILHQIHAARDLTRWITGEDLWVYVRDFFDREYPGSEFRQLRPDQLLFDVVLSQDARHDLDRFLRAQRMLHLTALTQNRPQGVRCAFVNRPSSSPRGQIESVTQFHPLVRFVSQRLREGESSYHPVVGVALARESIPSIPPGVYAFTVDRWSLRGLREIERLCFVAGPLDGDLTLLAEDESELLVTTAARFGSDWLAARNLVDLAVARERIEYFLGEAEMRYEAYVRAIESENRDRADVREQSLRRHWRRQRDKREQLLARHRALGRTRLLPAIEGQIAALDERMSQRLREIERQRAVAHHRDEICIGLVQVA